VTPHPIIVPVVEGHGEVDAVPVLLRRLTAENAPGPYIDVAKPIRRNKGSLLKEAGLERSVELAARRHGGNGAVLVLMDADDDCAATLGPRLQERAQAVRPGSAIAVVLAVKEYECGSIIVSGTAGPSRRDLVTSGPRTGA